MGVMGWRSLLRVPLSADMTWRRTNPHSARHLVVRKVLQKSINIRRHCRV